MKRFLISYFFERKAIFLIVISSTVPLRSQLEFECLMESSNPLAES
ncbi:MAG: hypothetical protein IPN60_06780 [Saprospiraceae bacterium]|nr:hypothetical protein [Candidatus Opimibacter skivensis]MBP8085788.1 hypothetical protein [Saprospiraceae bacterium]